MEEVRIIGLMSGSSLDGIDLAICSFHGDNPDSLKWNIETCTTIPFETSLKARLSNAAQIPSIELLKLEADFSFFCAEKINALLQEGHQRPHYIAAHGHTIFHHPEHSFTCQIINGGLLATKTNIPAIVDVRSNDVALGGQGAPIAPISELWLFPGFEFYINLGGIANFSCHEDGSVYSLDSCPCNQILNNLCGSLGLEYDDRGLIARKGKVDESLLEECLALPYFSKNPPKSMDNTWVQKNFMSRFHNSRASTEDKLATMIEIIAIQLSSDMGQFKLTTKKGNRAMVTGGGAYNDFLIDRIRNRVNHLDLQLVLPDSDIIAFKEAVMMGLMGYLRVKQVPNTIQTVTGAERPTCGGALYLP